MKEKVGRGKKKIQLERKCLERMANKRKDFYNRGGVLKNLEKNDISIEF